MNRMKLLGALLLALFSSFSWAAEISSENLIGKWEFVNWADSETPDQTHAVNLVMEFKADGQVITEMRKGAVSESYKIEGDTIIYHGKRGDQKWNLVSLIPGESMVVDHSGAIMTFRRK